MAEESLKITLSVENKAALEALKKTADELGAVEVSSGKAGNAAGKLGKDFTGVSRVIQDLPYGFNAISNNLTQLIPAAGLAGVAFSGIITALTFAQVGFGAWTRGMGGATQATQEAAKANEEYLSSLAKEQVSLDTLFRTATNANVPLKARLQAVKELRDNYGEYLKNFSDESIMAGKATDAYNKLTTSILMAARARAAQDMMVEKQKELLKIEQEITNQQEIVNKRKAEIQKEGATITPTTMGAVGQILTVNEKLAIQDARLVSLTKDRTARIAELRSEMERLAKTGQENVVGPFKISGGTKAESKKKEVDLLKQESEEMLKQSLLLNTLKGKMAGEGVQAQEKRKLKDLTNLKLTTDGNQALNEVMLRQSEIQDQRNANLALANNLTDYAMQGLTNLVNVMANGGNIGAALGDMFKKLAVDIALAAAKAAIFQAILSAISPGAGAGGGGFLKGFGKLLGFAEGGTVSGPTTGYPVMLHGTEHIVRPDQMKSIIASASQMGGTSGGRVEVFGRIQGQDIWLSQQRTNTFRKLST